MIATADFTDLIRGILQVFLVIAVAVIPIAGTFGGGIYVLRPLDRAARQKKLRTQFTIVDFLALIATYRFHWDSSVQSPAGTMARAGRELCC
jgi:hypothetical protein